MINTNRRHANRRAWTLVLVLLISSLLAGCTDNEPPESGPTMPEPGTIEGQVLDDAGLPVPDATVRLLHSTHNATTGTNGDFRMGDVGPGPAVLVATKSGYSTQTQRGNLTPGDRIFVEFNLQEGPRADPRHETLVFDGLIPCGLVAGLSCGPLVEGEMPRHHFEVDPGLAGIVLELQWSATEPVAQTLRLDATAATPQACGEMFATGTGGSVLQIQDTQGFPIAGGHLCALVLPEEDAAFQQEYTLYVTLFYHAEPDSGFTAIE